MSKIYLATFSGNSLGNADQTNLDLAARQNLLNHTATKLGLVDGTFAWNWQDLVTTRFYQRNKAILDQPRGGGYWAWKPYIILQSLKKLSTDDWLIYSDIGKPFRRNDPKRAGKAIIGNVLDTPFDDAIRYAQRHNGFTPGIWIPHYGVAKTWCKRDCFVGMSCDSPEYHNSGQVQAGYSIWSNIQAAHDFLSEWLRWCELAEVISDKPNVYGKPNFDEFQDHRHDQAILTNLVVKQGIQLFGPRDHSLGGYRDFNMILRHMMLADSLKNRATSFAELFKPEYDELPTWLREVLQLYALPAVQKHPRVWAYHGITEHSWQSAFTDSELLFGPQRSATDKNQFGAIFAHKFTSESNQKKEFEHLYQALAPGGVLLIGPVDGTAEEAANQHGNFNQLLSWIDLNQALPIGMGSEADQRRNGITLGNTRNPVIAHGPGGKGGYAIIRKPAIRLAN